VTERGTDASEYGNEMGWSEGDDLRMEKVRCSVFALVVVMMSLLGS